MQCGVQMSLLRKPARAIAFAEMRDVGKGCVGARGPCPEGFYEGWPDPSVTKASRLSPLARYARVLREKVHGRKGRCTPLVLWSASRTSVPSTSVTTWKPPRPLAS